VANGVTRSSSYYDSYYADEPAPAGGPPAGDKPAGRFRRAPKNAPRPPEISEPQAAGDNA
jgi:hypothetical protein